MAGSVFESATVDLFVFLLHPSTEKTRDKLLSFCEILYLCWSDCMLSPIFAHAFLIVF